MQAKHSTGKSFFYFQERKTTIHCHHTMCHPCSAILHLHRKGKLQSFHKRQQDKKRREDTVNKKAAADAFMQLACDSGLNGESNDHHDEPNTDGAIHIETDSTRDSNLKSNLVRQK